MKNLSLILVFLIVNISLLRAQENAANLGYELVNNLPIFTEQLKAGLTFPLARQNSSIDDFDEWRKVAREKLLECMHPAPPSANFDMEVIGTEKRDGYEVLKIALNLSQYSRVVAYLLVPDGDGPFPAIVMLHDHGAHFTIGKEKMVKPFGVDEEIRMDAKDWTDKNYDGAYVGDTFAKEGYVVLATDALFWGDRGRKEGARYDSQQALAAALFQMGYSWGSLITWDDMRSADFLAELPMVDKECIGALGFSMGAHRAWMLAAASDRVKATAAICWMTTTDSDLNLSKNYKGGSSFSMIIPGIRRYLDFPHVASIACPKPMYLINGKQDKLFPVDGVQHAFGKMEAVWKEQQVADRLRTELWDTPHIFNKEMQLSTIDFFDKWFTK